MSSSTRRSTPSRAVAAVALAALVGAMLVGCAGAGQEEVYAGEFGPTSPVSILNRTIGDGEYRIGYSLWVFVAPQAAPVEVSCTIVDTSGRIGFFADLEQLVPSGRWTKIAAEGDFDLPDLTLGLRCHPVVDTTMSLIVRDASLDVEER